MCYKIVCLTIFLERFFNNDVFCCSFCFDISEDEDERLEPMTVEVSIKPALMHLKNVKKFSIS